MDEIELFDELLRAYEACRLDGNVGQFEGAPADNDMITHAESIYGAAFPSLMRRFYLWRNGILHLNGFFHLVGLEEGLEMHALHVQMIEDGGLSQAAKAWIPFADLNGNYFFAIDTKTGSVVGVDLIDELVCDSRSAISEIATALIHAFRDGEYDFNPRSKVIEIHSDKWCRLFSDWIPLRG